jgi:hypothetical protein
MKLCIKGHYADCRLSRVFVLNAVTLNVVMLKCILLSVVGPKLENTNKKGYFLHSEEARVV